jgi:hypothetical protein
VFAFFSGTQHRVTSCIYLLRADPRRDNSRTSQTNGHTDRQTKVDKERERSSDRRRDTNCDYYNFFIRA